MSKTSKAFRAWRKRLKLTQVAAAKVLGLGKTTVANYDAGKRHAPDGDVVVPKIVLLACRAVEHKLPPVGTKD